MQSRGNIACSQKPTYLLCDTAIVCSFLLETDLTYTHTKIFLKKYQFEVLTLPELYDHLATYAVNTIHYIRIVQYEQMVML